MNEERLETYRSLINQLLTCSSDEEFSHSLISLAYLNLADSRLTQTMLEMAEDFRIQGDLDKSNFLKNIVEELTGMHHSISEPQLDFFIQVLQATLESHGDRQKVYPLLSANIDKLDDRFAGLLRAWVTNKLAEVGAYEAECIAEVLSNLSTLIQEFPWGDKASNMEIAIIGNEIALTVFTREAFPQDWAVTQYNLGNAYYYRIRGDKGENLEKAIACYQEALKVKTFEAFPQAWAGIQFNLGQAYLDRIRGDKGENLEKAIACYQEALKVRTFEAFPQAWVHTQFNLGLAYYYRIRGNKADNLEKAIACYRETLKVHTPDAFPQDWAMTQNNLGNAYLHRIRGDKADNLEKAIACYQEALKVRTFEAFPQNWAMTQSNLGLAYCDRIEEERAENLEKAIACYRESLKVYAPDTFPYEWARTQNNYGNAYLHRIKGDKALNFELAIFCYQEALKVRTFEAFPQDWATTQNNLGLAYSYRIRGDRAENLEQAIAYYRESLKVYTFDAFPYEWARTQNNLGLAYSYRSRWDRAENLEQAISYYEEALKRVFTSEAFPYEWARTQIDLGNAYRDRIRGERAENLEQAISYYEEALNKVYTFDTFPYEWAMTQNALGDTYLNRIRGERAENLEQAISYYKEALNRVFTSEAFPHECSSTLGIMGAAYQEANQLELAYTTFASAITTLESLREEIVSGEESKRKLAEDYYQIYHRMVDVCLKLSKIAEAIEYVERSKTRNLVELLLNRDLRTIFPSDVVTQLEQYRDEIATKQYQIQTSKVENPKDLAKNLQELRQKRNQLQNRYFPIGSGFQFENFQNNLDDHTAIVEFYPIRNQLLAFIFTRQTQQPIVWQSEPKELDKLQKYFRNYFLAYYTKKSHWQRRLTARLHLLARILHIDEIIQHIPLNCHKLILIPHRILHFFPLHALPIWNSRLRNLPIKFWLSLLEIDCLAGILFLRKLLFDIFPGGIHYAPSCQLLQIVQNRERLQFQRLFVIQNPTPDLYEHYEHDLGTVEVIKKQFDDAFILKQDKAKKAAVIMPSEQPNKELLEANCLFCFCHGYFHTFLPLNSWLRLADDYLTLADIITHFNLENCRLVTLAACETGITDVIQISDEYIGLPYGFLLAGSTNVVCSLWKVSATATALLMIKFYEELRQQDNIAVALATAQSWLRDTTVQGFRDWIEQKLSLRRQIQFDQNFSQIEAKQGKTVKPFESPYYWAAFCSIGKGV